MDARAGSLWHKITGIATVLDIEWKTLAQANMRLVEKKIIDDILGSAAYDSRIRPGGRDSKSKLQDIFCQRDSSTWSWKRCQFATSDKEPFGEVEGGREVFRINEQQFNLIRPFLDTLTCENILWFQLTFTLHPRL